MKKITACAAASLPALDLLACPLCNPQIRDAIFDSRFYPNLLTMLSAFIVLALFVALFSWLALRWQRIIVKSHQLPVVSPVPMIMAAMVLGIGLGGFFDGIVFHQILQAHEMLSNRIPANNYIGKSVNMFWDGIFHLFCLLTVIAGIALLWLLSGKKGIDRSGRLLVGGSIMGWGLFNGVEGIIDHQVLKLHNVIEVDQDHSTANYAFLASAVILVIIGFLLCRKDHPATKLHPVAIL